MDTNTLNRIDTLIRREVVPATGCTEPACVALVTAYASSLLSAPLSQITLYLSANMIKNAMGVGIPGTGMVGIPIAIALGALLKLPTKQLEILDTFTDEELKQAKMLVDTNIIRVELRENVDKLYAEAVIIDRDGHTARAVIKKTHTGLNLLELDGIAQEAPQSQALETIDGCSETIPQHTNEEGDIMLNFELVYEYATTAPLEQLEFIYEAALQNKRVSEHSLGKKYGHGVGRLIQSDQGRRYMGDSPLTQMLITTSSACDARMDGAPVTVMSNSGSGNQGITATLPVLTFAETQGASREKTVRALMLSSLMVVYIKQLLGRLSCLCGMVVSGIGTSAALVYLMNGTKEQSGFAIKNMVGNVTGMICDGAKPGCSLKASTGIGSAMISALLAMENQRCSSIEGIVAEDIDSCIINLTAIGSEGMQETDRRVLSVMTGKA